MDKHECNCNEAHDENECNCETGCKCGCGHDHEEIPIITLALDDNSDLDCNVVGIFTYKENDYIALVPVDEEEVLFYIYQELGDEMVLNNIEDDDEYDKIAHYFSEITDGK
ncbi:DUF1292 domain-containing protein [Clostridium sp. DL1XJH146]